MLFIKCLYTQVNNKLFCDVLVYRTSQSRHVGLPFTVLYNVLVNTIFMLKPLEHEPSRRPVVTAAKKQRPSRRPSWWFVMTGRRDGSCVRGLTSSSLVTQLPKIW